jgi:hypothetical protein
VPKSFDILSVLGKFGVDRKLSLLDPEAKQAFVTHISEAVDRALADPALMHGQRTEAMFEALLISLGEFRLLKPEDNGRVFPADCFSTPDFRVVLNDGAQWLIEVKNVYEADAFSQARKLMDRDYHGKLAAYAAATGAELKLAVFWARWSLWTLVSPDRLVDEAGDLTLDMMTAMRVNEFGRLGDMSIGTRAPLRLRLTTDAARTSPIGPDGRVEVVFGGSHLFCEDREILDPVEREIAWIFMQHGEWEGLEPEPIIDGNRLLAFEFRWAPREPSDQGFDFIGSLSRMFARYYAENTIKDRTIVQLRAPLRPGWFSPLIRRDHESQALPLWRFTLQPNYAPFSEPTEA